MTPVMIGIYLVLCLLLAVAGRHSRAGSTGVFLLAVIFTPLAVGIVLAILRPLPKAKRPRTTGNG